jgi:hypothetical protein
MCFPGTNSLINIGNMDCGKAALLFATLALQLHMLSISFDGYSVQGSKPDLTDRDDAVKAFLILAFLSFIAAQVLLLLMTFVGDFRGNKIVGILVMLILIFAGTLHETTKRPNAQIILFKHERRAPLSAMTNNHLSRGGAVALYTVLWTVVAKYRKWPFSASHRTKTL